MLDRSELKLYSKPECLFYFISVKSGCTHTYTFLSIIYSQSTHTWSLKLLFSLVSISCSAVCQSESSTINFLLVNQAKLWCRNHLINQFLIWVAILTSEIIHADWLKLIRWLVTANHSQWYITLKRLIHMMCIWCVQPWQTVASLQR